MTRCCFLARASPLRVPRACVYVSMSIMSICVLTFMADGRGEGAEVGQEIADEEAVWYEEPLDLFAEDAALLCGFARFRQVAHGIRASVPKTPRP